MPFINIKLVKNQVSAEQKLELIEGITDLAVKVMGRERNYTVVTVDEMEPDQWAIGGKTLAQIKEPRTVSLVNMKISKGTSNPGEMARMMSATKELLIRVLGNSDETNYFIIDELNPNAWGFGGIPMTVHNSR